MTTPVVKIAIGGLDFPLLPMLTPLSHGIGTIQVNAMIVRMIAGHTIADQKGLFMVVVMTLVLSSFCRIHCLEIALEMVIVVQTCWLEHMEGLRPVSRVLAMAAVVTASLRPVVATPLESLRLRAVVAGARPTTILVGGVAQAAVVVAPILVPAVVVATGIEWRLCRPQNSFAIDVNFLQFSLALSACT